MASSSQVRRSRREQLETQRLAQFKKERRIRITIVVVGLVILFTVIAVFVYGYLSSRDDQAAQTGGTVPPGANSGHNGMMLAPETKGVPTLEIWSDYNCTACKSAHMTLNATLEQAVTDGKANVVLHQKSGNWASSWNANLGAACADIQGKFTDYNHQLYLNQPSDESGFTDTMLRETIPDAIGLYRDDLTTFQTCFDTKAAGQFVDAQQTAALKANITSTPTFVLDGKNITSTLYNQKTGLFDPDLLRTALGM
ncbi:MAG: DsbA family protein [Propionibacteriaceae bacterium]|jgi:protein-disulfide isomerase|nr:DsbA family protein [Propionibacteriaceae bacterium]